MTLRTFLLFILAWLGVLAIVGALTGCDLPHGPDAYYRDAVEVDGGTDGGAG